MKTLRELEQESLDIEVGYEHYSSVNAKCEVCGGQLYINNSVVIATYPPYYQYMCPICGHVETSRLHLS